MKIYEAAVPTGAFVQIESVSAIGTYPNYIDEYTTETATSASHYFCIEFLDSKGATTGLSAPVKGDTELIIGEISQRVLERDSSLNERVVLQEAESAISYAFPAYDPYDPALSSQIDYVEKRGLTNLTLAMCYLTEMARTPGFSWTAGIVNLKTSDAAIKMRAQSIDRLITQANRDLNLTFSMIAFLEDIPVAGQDVMELTSVDISRLIIERTKLIVAPMKPLESAFGPLGGQP
jgi:hypothetical protein